MSSWNDQSLVNSYSDSADNPDKNWYEDEVNIPSILGLVPQGVVRILDFGSGPGNFAARIGKDYEAVGADSSEAMVEKARQKYPDVPFFVWDGLEPLPQDQEPFDAIVTKLTLEFVEDLENLAQNLHGALKEGGSLIISVQHPLLAIAMHPEENIPYWGVPRFDVQIGTTGDTVTKVHRNLRDYIEPFVNNGFTLAIIDEPQIPEQVSARHEMRPIDQKFPKRLNIQFRKS